MVFIAEMQSADQIPKLAEPPLQEMDENVEFHIVRSFDDLIKAISRIQSAST